MSAKATKPTEDKAKLIPIRLQFESDALLRKNMLARLEEGSMSPHGMITRGVIEALENTDWMKVEVRERPRNPHKNPEKVDLYATTSIKLPNTLYRALSKAAAERGISMTILIDGCVNSYYKNLAKEAASKEVPKQ